MPRVIVHLDADAFFASVEQAANVRLRGKPIAVGGERRGIIASASYEARKFGVFTPMPTARARKLCPKLVVLPGDFERYEQFSHWMFGCCYDFTPEVEQTSIDEGYFDLTANHQKPALEIAQAIRQAIRQSLKITVSEGIGANKLVSQIASKLHKPATFMAVPPGGEISFLHPLPNHWLPGVGPKTAVRLDAAGLAKIRHVAATPLDLLELLLGSQAREVRKFADGIDERPLIPAREPQKSFSQQETFAEDQTDEGYIEAVLRRMADQLFAKVREESNSIRTLTVRVRYNDMAEDQCSNSLIEPTDLEADVYGALRVMLQRAWKRRVSLRMVSLKLANVYPGVFRTELALDRAAAQHEARERLARTVDELRRVKGATVLLRGHDFVLKEGPRSQTRPQQVVPSQADAAGASHTAATPERRTPVRRVGERLLFCAGSETGAPKSATRLCIPLRCHSYHSFLDSTLSPKAIVELAKQHGCPAVAITDTGNLHGAVEFAQAAQEAGIKPIFGAEVRVGTHPLLLYVENARGYANLCRLLSQTQTARSKSASHPLTPAFSLGKRENHRPSSPLSSDEEKFNGFGVDENKRQLFPLPEGQGEGGRGSIAVADFHRRAFRLEILACFTDGLIAVSSDASLASLFPGRFYQLATNRSSNNGLPMVACPSIRYATPGDRLKFDIIQSIRTRTLLRQAHSEKQLGGRHHFRTPAELAAGCQEHPEWLTHAREIAERCQFEFPFGQPQFPAVPPPDGTSSREFLRRSVLDGAHRRYHSRRIVSDTGATVPLETVLAQIETELAIIAEVGYEDLFLITWDLLKTCCAHGIEWITRGSAADSLVCYCLGISDVCPIRFGLYFRRFLNKERMALHKLPDIDVDFPHDRKDDVVDLLFEKYGPDRCAVVGGFSTFQARSAVGDVAKVLGVSEHQIRRFTENFPWSFGGGWNAVDELRPKGNQVIELLRASPECRDLPLEEEPFRTAVEMAAFLDGFPRHPKMHPCGVVLSRQPMHELTPTFHSNKGWPTTHFDMDAVEAIGLVKMDVLAQGGLAVMRDARETLRARGLQVDLQTCTATLCCSTDFQSAVSPTCSRQSDGSSQSSGIAGACRLEICDTAECNSPLRPLSLHPARPEAVALLNPQSTLASPARPRDLQFNDPAIWEMIASGNARAVHHIESPAMISLCRMSNVREIDGLIAIVSVIRPGAANEQKKVKFTRRYQGLEPPEYPHPSLEPCLRSTFGLVVYEEHILQICEAFAGLSPGRADVLRRALVKQNHAAVAKFAAEFAAAAQARGHCPEKILEVWELATGFSGYAFCKAHSTAYGVEAYQAAWLKHYYPAEFMSGVLTNGKGFYDPLVYVLECHRLGLKFLPPSVNQPGPAFTVEYSLPARFGSAELHSAVSPICNRQWAETMQRAWNRAPSAECNSEIQQIENLRYGGGPATCTSKIRVPAVRAKGLTERTIECILAERQRGPFASLADFCRRAAPLPEEMETLIRLGAFDEFGRSRTAQFWEFQQLHRVFGQSARGQGWLLASEDLNRLPATVLCEPTRRERLEAETELLGFAVSGHPLELFDHVAWDTYCPVARLAEHPGEEVVTCGLIVEQRTHHQVTGEPMKFLSLADWTGIVETELFAATYKSYGLAAVRYPVLEVTARVEPFENGHGFTLRVLRAGKPRSRT